jgi:NAD(P)H-hydrate epimerase
MNVLSRKEMYFFDKYTMEEVGISSKTLMETAGKGCSEFIRNNLLLPQSEVLICCGSGNNGGDGLVIARYLKEWGYLPQIVLLGKAEKMSPETSENFKKCQALKIKIDKVNSATEWQKLQIKTDDFDYFIDAIFGIGFRGRIKGWRRQVIEDLNKMEALKVAIDIASGIDADTGNAELALRVDYTLTMAALKYGHLLMPGREISGELKVIDIGIPSQLYEKFPPVASLVTEDSVQYPFRSRFYHKGYYGKVGIIAGSSGLSGAAVMASRAALRSGSGLITLFHPAGMQQIFETQLLEVMTYEMPAWQTDLEATPGFKEFQEKIFEMDVLLIGPGLGIATTTKKMLQYVLKNWPKPVVIDADGLNNLATDMQLLKMARSNQILLTPHIGEFCRLTGLDKNELNQDIIGALDDFIGKYKVKVLLKSCTTIFANSDHKIFDISGNDALATGGSGDVLAGIITSFLGQKLPVPQAASSASYLLGKTAEDLSGSRASASVIPSDIIENIFTF